MVSGVMKRKKSKHVLETVSAAVDGGQEGDDISVADDRGQWDNQCEFILSCLGFAVGFGNVWRFPYLCYKNGGAVFLIPYITMLICAGLPMFFMELAMGQYVGLGPKVLFPNMAPLFSGLGIAMPIISFYVSTYFGIIIAWSFYYTFSSFTSELPWGNCDADYNTPQCATTEDVKYCQEANNTFYYDSECLSLTDICHVGGYEPCFDQVLCNNASLCYNVNTSETLTPGQAVHRMSSSEDFYKNGVLGVQDSTFEDMGSLQWGLVGCLALGWLLVLVGLARGVKSSGKAIYFTALFPYVVLTILLCFGLTLDGAMEGIEFYFLKPNVTKLKEIEVWTDASTQIFFSLGSSFGSLITLASYNKFTTNCMRDAMIIATANCLTSVYAGFVLFSVLGSLAYELGVPVSEVVSSGSGLAFIAYPQAVLNMPPPQLWSILFFVMFITLGLSSQFAMVETVNTALYDQWPFLRSHKPLVAASVCGVMFLFGIPMCLQGGVFLFEIMNLYSAGTSVLIIASVEIILVQYIYGHKKLMQHIQREIGIHIPLVLKGYWKATWLVVTPISLIGILVLSLVFWVPAYWGDYLLPDAAQALGWLICLSSVIFLPLMAIVVCFQKEYQGKDLIRATEDFCPAKERRRRERAAATAERFGFTNPLSPFSPWNQTIERRRSKDSASHEPSKKISDF